MAGKFYAGGLAPRQPAFVGWRWEAGGWIVAGVGQSRAEVLTFPRVEAITRGGQGPPPPPAPLRGGLAAQAPQGSAGQELEVGG